MIRAVIVGLDRYASPSIPPLRYAVADAKAFESALASRFSAAELDVRAFHDDVATRRNVTIAIADALPRDAGPDDVVVLYFAGHGSPEAESSPDQSARYLVVHDTEYENICATGIDLEHELTRWLKRIESPRVVVVFLDACFSGLAGGRTFEGPRLRRMRASRPILRDIERPDLELGEGRLILAACDDDQVASENSMLGHGVFTFYLLESLTSSAASSSTIDVVTLYHEVAIKVKEHTRGEQIPVLNGRSRMARLPMLSPPR